MQEEIYWRQKSRITWLREGDNNTKFFHAVVQHNRRRNTITEIEDEDGNSISNPADIERLALDFYQKLFTSEGSLISDELLAYIPSLVSEEDNNLLLTTPSSEEIRSATFSLSADSAPGPEGFTGTFFTFCWDIVSADVIAAVRDFFFDGFL